MELGSFRIKLLCNYTTQHARPDTISTPSECTETPLPMAEAFIGLSVLATLRDPPGAKVRGLVIDVADQQLTLNKGMFFVFPHPRLQPTMII